MAHTCKEILQLLSDYIDGEMDDETRERMRQHLEDCPPCDEFLDEFRSSIKLVHETRNETMPDEMKRRLHNFLTEEVGKGK